MAKVKSMQQTYVTEFTRRNKCDSVIKALQNADIEAAADLLARIEPNQYDANYQKIMGRYYYFLKDYDESFRYIERLIQLQKYNSDNYGDRAKIYIAWGDYSRALKDLRYGYGLNDSSKYILDGLANTFFTMQEYDSTIYYAGKRLLIDSSNANYYYLVAESYLKKRDLPNAKTFAARYAAFNLQEPAYQKKLKELIAEIEKFNK